MRQELTASFVLQEWSETYPTIFNILLIILIQLQYIYHKALQNHAPNISLFANMSVNVNIGEKQPKMYFLDINKTISGLPLKYILVLLQHSHPLQPTVFFSPFFFPNMIASVKTAAPVTLLQSSDLHINWPLRPY